MKLNEKGNMVPYCRECGSDTGTLSKEEGTALFLWECTSCECKHFFWWEDGAWILKTLTTDGRFVLSKLVPRGEEITDTAGRMCYDGVSAFPWGSGRNK